MSDLVSFGLEAIAQMSAHAILYPLDLAYTSQVCHHLPQQDNTRLFWWNQFHELAGTHWLVTLYRRYVLADEKHKFTDAFYTGFWSSMMWKFLQWSTQKAFFLLFGFPPFLAVATFEAIVAPQSASLLFKQMDRKEPEKLEMDRLRFETLLSVAGQLAFGATGWYFHTRLPGSLKFGEQLARNIQISMYATYAAQPLFHLYHRAKIDNKGVRSFLDLWRFVKNLVREEGPLALWFGTSARLRQISLHGALTYIFHSYLLSWGFDRWLAVFTGFEKDSLKDFDDGAWNLPPALPSKPTRPVQISK